LTRPAVRTTALVVRLADHGEADRIVGLFSRGLGLISAIAKSARRSTKRFGGALQSGQLLDVELVRSTGTLARLESARIVDPHLGLLTDLAKLDEAAMVLRSLRDHLPENEPDPELFDFACLHLEQLAADGPSASRRLFFRLRLFDRLGVGPSLEQCVRCGKAAGDRAAYVDPRQGGLVCRACGGGGLVVSADARALARALREADEFPSGPDEASPADMESLAGILDAIGAIHLGSRAPRHA